MSYSARRAVYNQKPSPETDVWQFSCMHLGICSSRADGNQFSISVRKSGTDMHHIHRHGRGTLVTGSSRFAPQGSDTTTACSKGRGAIAHFSFAMLRRAAAKSRPAQRRQECRALLRQALQDSRPLSLFRALSGVQSSSVRICCISAA